MAYRRNLIRTRLRWQKIEQARLFRHDWRDIKPWPHESHHWLHRDVAQIVKSIDTHGDLWAELTAINFGLTGNQLGVEYSYTFDEFEAALLAAGERMLAGPELLAA